MGMSPNNDGHIFECIYNNKKLKRVYFYAHSDDEFKTANKVLPHSLFIVKKANSVWEDLKDISKAKEKERIRWVQGDT